MTHGELKQHRESLGMSIADMARLLRIHRQTYVKWERGEQSMPAVAESAVLMLLHMRGYHPCLLDWIEDC